MKMSERWLLACVVTVIVLVVGKLEANEVINSNVRAVVSSSEDVVLLQKMVKQAVNREDEKIVVSTAVQSQKLLEFINATAQDDGYLLTFEKAPTIQALQDGYIIFTGHTKKTGKTMTVHYGKVAVTYGQLDTFNHLPYTTVVAGEMLALKGTDSPLFIRMEKEGQVLNLDEMLPLLQEWEVQ